MVKKKETKSTSAKSSKKKVDYGTKVDNVDVPNGFVESVGTQHFSFTQFGDEISGTFISLEKIKGRGKSNIIHFLDEETGAPRTAFSCKSLNDHIETTGLQDGDKFKAIFTDTIELSGGRNPMKNFRFFVEQSVIERQKAKAGIKSKKG